MLWFPNLFVAQLAGSEGYPDSIPAEGYDPHNGCSEYGMKQ